MGKTNFQCIKKVANYLTALKKEQHKKYIEFTLKEKKRATITLQPCLQGEKW